MESIFASKEYRQSRTAYIVQCTFEYFVSILVTDAFLAKLLTEIGISDVFTGIISSLISFSFLFQLFSILLVKRMRNTKKTVIIFDTVSQLFFMGIYFIPFLNVSALVKTVMIITGIIAAYFLKYLIATICFKWANSFVAPEKRAEFSAIKEMVSLGSGIVFTMIMGYVFDYFDAIGNIEGGFLFTAICMFALNVSNFICLSLMKNSCIQTDNVPKKTTGEVMKNTLGNRSFVYIIIMTSLWETARYMTIGFLGTFKINDLLISVGSVQIINVAASLARLALSKPFGKFSDKTSYVRGFNLALVIAAMAFAVNMFSTRPFWWCIVIYTVLYNVCLAGINQNAFNMTYSYVKSDYISQALALKGSIGGILGFGASIVGSRILSVVQENGNRIFGITLYGQQLLSAISFVLIVVAIVFNFKVVYKQKVIHQ